MQEVSCVAGRLSSGGTRDTVGGSAKGNAMPIRALLFLLLSCLPAMAQERVVNVYNWTDYIDPYAVARFTRETGIKVRYDVYDSLETLEAKLLAGRSGYDVVVPTSEPTFSRLVRTGALQPLDRAAIPLLGGLDPALMQQVEKSDPGGGHGAIYLWGATGLGFDESKVRALAPDADLGSWDLLFKPENARRISKCGINMSDSATDVIPSVLRAIGRSPDSTDAADLDAVEKALRAIRPYIRSFSSSSTIEALAGGEACMVLSYSGDIIQAAARAKEAGSDRVIRFVAPREGAQLSFDMLAVPKDAPHPAEAMAFINFLLQPDVMAGITNQVRYPNAVPASLKLVQPEIASNPAVYPPAEVRQHFFTVGPVSADATRARARMWTRFKAGR
jgi:putrescine transport system substrate-binding protein